MQEKRNGPYLLLSYWSKRGQTNKTFTKRIMKANIEITNLFGMLQG